MFLSSGVFPGFNCWSFIVQPGLFVVLKLHVGSLHVSEFTLYVGTRRHLNPTKFSFSFGLQRGGNRCLQPNPTRPLLPLAPSAFVSQQPPAAVVSLTLPFLRSRWLVKPKMMSESRQRAPISSRLGFFLVALEGSGDF